MDLEKRNYFNIKNKEIKNHNFYMVCIYIYFF